MPRCSVIGCKNNSGCGKVMKSFPKDPVLLKIWEAKINRKDWKPARYSKICEVREHTVYSP